MTWHRYPPPEVPWSAGRLVNNDLASLPGLHGVALRGLTMDPPKPALTTEYSRWRFEKLLRENWMSVHEPFLRRGK